MAEKHTGRHSAHLKEVGIETELEVLEVGAAFAKPMQGWEGIFSPGFPNASTVVGIADRWGQPNNYVSFYRPPGWQEKWNALYAQLDDKKRLSQMKDLLKMLYDEAAAVPYQGMRRSSSVRRFTGLTIMPIT